MMCSSLQFSKSALPVVCMKSGLCPVVANDQFWHVCCLHTHGMRMKNALTVSGQPEVGYLKRVVKRYGWLDHPRWVRNALVLCHVNYNV
jgi:hypothetical protein